MILLRPSSYKVPRCTDRTCINHDSSRRRGGFESGCSRHFSPRTPYQSFHSDYHVLMVSARQRQLWEACGMDSQTSGGTLYQEKENLPLRDRSRLDRAKGRNFAVTNKLRLRRWRLGRAGNWSPEYRLDGSATIDYATAVGASRYRSCGIDYSGGGQFFSCPPFLSGSKQYRSIRRPSPDDRCLDFGRCGCRNRD